MDEFTFSTGRISDAALADLVPDFDTLQPNSYADGAYRYRRFSTFSFDRAAGVVTRLAPHDFVQDDTINHFQPGVARHYDDLLDSTWGSAGFAEVFTAFADAAGLPARATIEVHQLRVISTDPQHVAQTAPEGVHEDGFDRIAILTIARQNSRGADLSVHEAEGAEPFATFRSLPGQYLVLNDRLLWHSADPLVALDDSGPGYWDCFVLTANLA